MKLYYSDHIELQRARGSRFPVEKYRLLREHLQADKRLNFTFVQAQEVSVETLELAHARSYIQAVLTGTLSARSQRRIGFPWSENFVSRARCSVGATIAACKSSFVDGVSANLAGGTHHAKVTGGAGYCVFNDIAVASRLLTATNAALRILIVDADVHQGDGTADILGEDANVFTFSIHCMDNFPAKKHRSDLDVALMAGVADEEYLRQFHDGLTRALLASRPDLIIYLAGADPFKGDRLGRLNLTKDGLRRRDELVFDDCRRRFIPLAVVMGGGYAQDVKDIVDIHASTVKSAAALFHERAER